MTDKKVFEEKRKFTDEEINELAEWLEDLTLPQVFYLKESYENFLLTQALEIGNGQVH